MIGLLRFLFLLYLVWIPIPFGSVTGFAELPLVAIPLLLLILCLFSRKLWSSVISTRPWQVATAAGIASIALVAFQILPLPRPVVRSLSPAAFDIWSDAGRVHELMAQEEGNRTSVSPASFPSRYRLSVGPVVTRQHLFRLAAYFASFHLGFLLFADSRWRRRLAVVIILSAAGQVLYGLHALTSSNEYGTHSVLGWHNALIFRRATGTFVNPNHFAMYVAAALPLAASLLMSIWRRGSGGARRLSDRLSHFIAHGLVWFALAAIAALLLVGGILLSQSRAVLGATAAALLICGAIAALASLRERNGPKSSRRAPVSVLVGIALIALSGLWLVHRLGPERTTARLLDLRDDRGTVIGRSVGYRAAIGVWRRFPLFGSGLGTFDEVVLMEQSMEMKNIFNHAHNDYLELLATTGAVGLAVACAAVFGLWLSLASFALSRHRAAPRETSPRERHGQHDHFHDRRDYVIGCLTVLTVAMLHALVDFDFFIPAIPATIAVILGSGSAAARVAPQDHG